MEQIDATTTEPETAPGVNASCGEGPNRSLLTDFRKLRFEPTLQATPRIPIPSSQPSIHHSNSMLQNFIDKIGPGVFSNDGCQPQQARNLMFNNYEENLRNILDHDVAESDGRR